MNVVRTYIVPTVLAVSLAINFFIAGVFAGHSAVPPFLIHPAGTPPQETSNPLAALEAALPPQDAKVFHAAMERGLPTPEINDLKSSTEAVEAALRAHDFDPKAFQAALRHIHDQHALMDGAFVQSLSLAVTQISPEGRARLADVIDRLPIAPPGPGSPPVAPAP